MIIYCDFIDVNCAAYVIYSNIQTAINLLPIDIESILTKMYSYFYIYIVCTEELMEFGRLLEVEYQKFLDYSKIRLLTLLPCIERI